MDPNRTEYPDIRFDEASLVDERVIFEPRAWWQVVRIDSSVDPVQSGTNIVSRVTLDRNRFRNGSRHKLIFHHLLVAPIGYTLQERVVAAPADATQFDNCGGIIDKIDWFITAPRRQHLSKEDIRTSALMPEASWGPGTRYNPAPFGSSLFGVNRWTFERPLWLPRRGQIQFDISSAPESPADRSLTAPAIQTAMLLDERWPAGGRFQRHARFRERSNIGYAQANAGGVAAGAFYPATSQPSPDDAFPTAGSAGAQGMWSPTGVFDGTQWKRTEANRGAERTWYTGFAVHIDQIDHDQEAQLSAALVNQLLTPMSLRMGCRAKTVNGGTNEWWWREGAPIALVTPTMTPAHVFRFKEPLIMFKGDSLLIEVQAPPPATQFNPDIEPAYNIGISLCGYAVVEG